MASFSSSENVFFFFRKRINLSNNFPMHLFRWDGEGKKQAAGCVFCVVSYFEIFQVAFRTWIHSFYEISCLVRREWDTRAGHTCTLHTAHCTGGYQRNWYASYLLNITCHPTWFNYIFYYISLPILDYLQHKMLHFFFF